MADAKQRNREEVFRYVGAWFVCTFYDDGTFWRGEMSAGEWGEWRWSPEHRCVEALSPPGGWGKVDRACSEAYVAALATLIVGVADEST